MTCTTCGCNVTGDPGAYWHRGNPFCPLCAIKQRESQSKFFRVWILVALLLIVAPALMRVAEAIFAWFAP